MVTYLPTILMNVCNQALNYIEGETKYDLIIGKFLCFLF